MCAIMLLARRACTCSIFPSNNFHLTEASCKTSGLRYPPDKFPSIRMDIFYTDFKYVLNNVHLVGDFCSASLASGLRNINLCDWYLPDILANHEIRSHGNKQSRRFKKVGFDFNASDLG